MRFQDLWAVRQLLLVLAEELRSVRIEPAGLEGEGVDLVVTQHDGTIEYQQCKRSRYIGKWSIRALENEGVISTIRDRLQDNRYAIFRFVSADPAPELKDLCESAQRSLDAESFLHDQATASKDRQKALESFSRALKLELTRNEDLIQVHNFLRRTSATLVADDSATLRDLRSYARFWVDGNPDGVLSALESYVKQSLRNSITAAVIENFLQNSGFYLRVLARDSRILPAVHQLQETFEQSLQHQLVRGMLLPREEADQLFDLLTTKEGPTFIAVHGPAGVGKSGVLLALTQRLQLEGILHLPLRLDRQRPGGSTRQFGDHLGLPESPTHCLAAAADQGSGVLVLDQLDALRWTGSQAAEAIDTCRELVKEAIQFPNLKIVACCRSFDLENDPQIRGWVEQQHAAKLPVGRLSEETVKKVVAGTGIVPERISHGQIDLLRTVQHLRVWEQTVKVTGNTVDFATDQELLDAFWKSRLVEAERMGASAVAVQEAVDAVVFYMDKNATLAAPRRLLFGRGCVEDALLSLQVFTLTDSSITFSHQMYLDHQLAHWLLRRIDEGETVARWLTASHQSLFRREQLRLILGLLRQERSRRYTDTLHDLLALPDVRFHLKQVVLQFLGQVEDLRPAEIDLVASLFEEEEWREHVIVEIFYAHPAWVDALGGHFLANWLGSDEWKQERALRIIRSVIEERGEFCSSLLAPFVSRGADWIRRVEAVLRRDPAKDSSESFKLRVRLAEMGVRSEYLDWSGLGGPLLDRLVQLLTAVLSGLKGKEDASRPSSSLLHGLEKVAVSDVSLEALEDAWAALLPAAAEFLGPAGYAKSGFIVSSFVHDSLKTIALVERSNVPLGELLLLEALPQIDTTLAADRALEWLMSSPHRLRLRWSSSDLPWKKSQSAVEKLTQICSPGLRTSFERFLIAYKEPSLYQAMEWRHQAMLFPKQDQPRFHAWVLTQPSPMGETAYHLLSFLPKEQLSESGSRRLCELQRKFNSVDEIFFSGWGKDLVGSGSRIPQERLNKLSDRTWLDIIANNKAGTFGSDLQTATVQEPGRFTRLALSFSADSNPQYFRAVLQGLATDSKSNAEGEDATLEEMEALLALPSINAEPGLAAAVAWLIAHHPQLNWGPSTLRLLGSIATDHPDPGVGELRLYGGGNREDWGPENLVDNALNCTRGAATFAIGKLLFDDKKRLPLLSEAIERLVLDPHPAVRSEVFECCLAILRVSPERSIAWALQAAEGHEALLACSTFDRFLLFASQNYPDKIEPTINQMLVSRREDVACVGARHAVALYLLFGRMERAVRDCIHGANAWRVGSAQVAAAFSNTPEYHNQARAILAELMNDDEEKVLEACAGALHDATLDLFADSPEFLNMYAGSMAFRRHPTILLSHLKDHPGSLIPCTRCIFEVCRSMANSGRHEREKSFWEVDYYLSPVLLRLYEQAPEGSPVLEQCLDAWDLLLSAHAASAVSLTKKWEGES
ncbi:MAG: hypothetical protein QOF89_3704 [Acidobacteriota bacterium]|nr:hypothetical protein [Acidobacteriota bacterium]